MVALLNAWRTKPVKVADFLPIVERSEEEVQAPATQLAMLVRAFPQGIRVVNR